MAGELERRVVELVLSLTGGTPLPTPAWLVRPGKSECGTRWPLVQRIYTGLTGGSLPEVMRPVERRTVDLVFQSRGVQPRLLEVDEKQHFNPFRSETLRAYGGRVPVSFDWKGWIARGDVKASLEGGGFAKPRPPLFPGVNGRHKQRAFRDALSDILPTEHGFLPTLRIAYFEVASWIFDDQATQRLARHLAALGVRLN